MPIQTEGASRGDGNPNLAGLYRPKVEALKGALDNEEARTDAAIIRTLIVAVVFHPAGRSHEIALIGEVARMIEITLGANDKKPPLEGRL
jgi:hypothetical protein